MRNALAILSLTLMLAATASAQSDVSTEPVIGLRDNRPDDYALTGATVVTEPGRVIHNATVLIRDTAIIAVGTDVEIPAGFMNLDFSGRYIYPGLIDAFGEVDVATDPVDGKAGYWNRHITPERSAKMVAAKLDGPIEKLRSQGITSRVVAPQGGILKGSSAVVLLNDEHRGRTLLKPSAWQHAQLTVPKDRRGQSYPNSPMGAVALLRQSIYDARWYEKAWDAYRSTPTLPRPQTNVSLEFLAESIRNDTFVFDAQNDRMAVRADRIAKEFSLAIIIRGSGQEYRQLDEIAATHHPILLPVDFPKPPHVTTADAAQEITLKELMHWHFAPENPAMLAAAGVTICLTTDGLEDPAKFLSQVRIAVSRGLAKDDALAAMTTNPATLLGIDQHVGSVRPGMLANLVITDGELFDEDTEVLETWVAGQQFVIVESDEPSLDSVVGTWELVFDIGSQPLSAHMVIDRRDDKLSAKLVAPGAADATDPENREDPQNKKDSDDANETDESASSRIDGESVAKSDDETTDQTNDLDSQTSEQDEAKPKSIRLRQFVRTRDRITATVDLSKFSKQLPGGASKITFLTIEDPEGEISIMGNLVVADGSRSHIDVRHIDEEPAGDDPASADEDSSADNDAPASEPVVEPPVRLAAADKDKSDETLDQPDEEGPAPIELLFPLGAYGLTEPIADAPTVLFRGATVWTCDDSGKLPRGDVLIQNGVIADVGANLSVPSGCQVIDARGKHITPGLIDCHSHMGTDGGVNESGQVITAEVRIGDFIDNSDISIYRQLAGGLTIANVLHGSANPIGGQNQVIKLRWGQTMDGLRMTEAPPGIKFALGENVKRNRSRYPNTRMGVEQIIRDQLLAAREYESGWRRWHAGQRDALPPRVDLQLEAMSEVGHGQRWIHCHSYRQDEIVATLDVLEEFGVRIGTLQHILEGYKVADRMAAHGAMGSSFSDWWAYKFEVYDAIPYNGAVMHEQGVVVSFNSDDAELARRLNTEAAKATKYGGLSDEEALKFVTLNPAKQLRIDSLVGSITVGKHADLVLWNGPPLSTTTRCEQTWIDGRLYFDRNADARMRARDARLHARLVQLALGQGDGGSSPDKSVDEEDRWLRYDEFCGASGGNANGFEAEAVR